MSSSSVLTALSAVCGSSLRSFFLIEYEGLMHYVCMGKHCLYLLDREMQGTEEGGTLLRVTYGAIESVVVDEGDVELFELCVKSESLSNLVLRSPDRDGVLDSLHICWRTHYMYTHWRVAEFPVVLGSVDAAGKSASLRAMYDSFLSPPTTEVKYHYGGYFFFCPESFKEKRDRYTGLSSGRYCKRTTDLNAFDFFEMRVFRPVSIKALVAMGHGALQVVAQKVVEQIGAVVETYSVMEIPSVYHKKMNLVGDPAAWEAWQIYVRTSDPVNHSAAALLNSNRDIGIIALRRKYIPPVMDTAQDIVLLYYGRKNLFYTKETKFMEAVEGIADSLSVESRSFAADSIVVQKKTDALLLDEETYAWYQTQLGIQPSCVDDAKRFCRSILRLLSQAGVRFAVHAIFPELEEGASEDDPFEFAAAMEKNPPGLPDTAPPALLEDWQRRVWRYLAFCVDGGLLPHMLTLKDLVYHFHGLERRERNRLRRLLDNLLYLHPTGGHYEYAPLEQMVANDRLMKSFSFNESVMCALIESNYVAQVLEETRDLSAYPLFLVRLLRHSDGAGGQPGRLQYTVCKQLVTSSVTDAELQNEVALNILVPALIDLLYSSDLNLCVLAVVALVNYTRDNDSMKNLVMSRGAVRRVISFLSSKNGDLVRHSAALLNNCTKRDQYQQSIASYGAIDLLLDLLVKRRTPPYYHKVPILIQAATVLGNLAMDTRLRDSITRCKGYETVTDDTKQVRQSVALRILVSVLGEPFEREEAARGVLFEKITYTLRNLCVRNDSNKKTIGRLAIKTLVGLARDGAGGPLLYAIFQCIYMLVFLRQNCHLLHRERFIDDVLPQFSSVEGPMGRLISMIRTKFLERSEG
eukprot:PLAT5370.2.p1 GENE.PLAT5370.2~~PLAT5370.2.p1  ORF type:complete len:862 (+),score=500.89 PLAT5370.2:1-2586(+)